MNRQTPEHSNKLSVSYREILRQFLWVWLLIMTTAVTPTIVVFIVKGLSDKATTDFTLMLPFVTATMSMSIIGHHYWLYLPFFKTGRKKQYFLLLPVFAVASIFLDVPTTLFADFLETHDTYSFSLRTLRFAFMAAFSRVLIADWIGAFIYTTIREYSSARKLSRATEQEILQIDEQLKKEQANAALLSGLLERLANIDMGVHAPLTSDALQRLKDMFAHLRQQADRAAVPLKSELTFLRNYLQMQQLRLPQDGKVDLAVQLPDETAEYEIAPMLLLPFIENAFKYGLSYVHPSEITIRLQVENDTLSMKAANIIHTGGQKSASAGLGIVNTRKRLDLQYPGRHTLKTWTEKEHYHVFLSIDLSE